MYVQCAIIVDEAKFSEFMHENVNATARRTHQLGQCFLCYPATIGSGWQKLG